MGKSPPSWERTFPGHGYRRMAVPPHPQGNADRNLLFGILALQMDFISRDELVAGMRAWVLDKSKGLGGVLVRQGALRQDLYAALAIMVAEHLEVHGNDAQKSLRALGSVGALRHDLQGIADADVQASLAHVPEHRAAQEPSTVGRPTPAGTRYRISGLAAALLVGVIAASAATVWLQREQARQEIDAALRQAEASNRRSLADQSIRDALDQAEQARAELQAMLNQPGGVFALLNEPARWDAQVQAARAAVERARAATADAADAGIQDSIRQLDKLVRQDDDDRKTALFLEKIRLDRSTAGDPGLDNEGAARAYPQVFVAARFAIYDNTREVGARIVDSAIKDQWVAALDDWAGVALRVKQYDRVGQLVAMARDADPDPQWRDKVRQAKVLFDPEALADLSRKAPADKLSPQIISLIVTFLPKDRPERESLLRSGLIRFPGDFWLNLQMATEMQASNLTEAIGVARVAVVVRPHSAAAYNHLGTMLGKQGRLDEAVGAFEMALRIEPKSAPIRNNLAGLLHDHKRLP